MNLRVSLFSCEKYARFDASHTRNVILIWLVFMFEDDCELCGSVLIHRFLVCSSVSLCGDENNALTGVIQPSGTTRRMNLVFLPQTAALFFFKYRFLMCFKSNLTCQSV